MFIDALRACLRSAFPENAAIVNESVTISDRPDISDYQCNLALKLAKVLRRAPLDIAKEIALVLQKEQHVPFEVNVAPPGFVNIVVSEQGLCALLQKEDFFVAQASQKKTIVMDYGGPNVAKPLHVGHIRSAVLGESVKRILQHVGHKVIADVHMGDWGTQMGKVLYGLEQTFSDLYNEDLPLTFTFEDLEACYTLANQHFQDEKSAKTMRDMTCSLQAGDTRYSRIWRRVHALSVTEIKEIYDQLGASFDLWYGESRYQRVMPQICDLLEQKGLAHVDQGALIAPVAIEGESADVPPVLLRKKDGGFLYATTDLATIKERVEELQADAIVYVVDTRQNLHFEQIFRLAEKMGLQADFSFLGFGTVNGSDGRPFKTRDGGAYRLRELLQDMEQSVSNCMREKGRSLNKEVVHSIALAALKVGDMQQDMRHNYEFSVEKFTQFDGNTGPYLLYVCTRIKSLLAKCEHITPALNQKWCTEERTLAVLLLQHPDIILRAAKNFAPHIVCQYAFMVAGAYNVFYQNCPILSEEKSVQSHRVFLSRLTMKCLQELCHILGLEIPKFM